MPEGKTGEGPLQVNGRVLESLPNALYRVELDTEARPQVMAHVAGQAPLLRLRPGDDVVVELAPYDLGRGRIVGRV